MQDKKLCAICQKRQIAKGLPICNYCGSPDKITLYCAGCDNVQDLDDNAMANLQKLSLLKMRRPLIIPANIKTGIILKVTNCDKCPKPEETTIMIFRLGKDEKMQN